MGRVKLGALCWSQYTDWPSLLEAGRRADRLGYDTLWTWDHIYPIVGSWEGPILEGNTVLAAWAMATEREAMFAHNGAAPLWENQPVETPEDVVEQLLPAPRSAIGTSSRSSQLRMTWSP